MAYGLRNSRLKTYVGKIERETQAYLDKKWGAAGTVDLHTALSEITILTASRCLHGDDVREQLFEEVANLYHDLDQGVTPLSVFFPYAWTTAHAKRDRARKVSVCACVRGAWRERERERERERVRRERVRVLERCNLRTSLTPPRRTMM